MLNKHEQAFNIVGQLPLQKNEGLNGRWRGLTGKLVESARSRNVVAQIDGFPIDDSPRGLEAMVNAQIRRLTSPNQPFYNEE